MHKVYDQWPEIAKTAYNSEIEPTSFDGIDHVVFSGMGGSGTVGDLFAAVLSKTNLHATIVKGYLLPKTVDSRTLVVCTSVSGNTAETLAVAKSAKKTDCKMICFSSGGKLEKFCNHNHTPFRRINTLLNPRSSLPAYVYSMIRALNSILPISFSDVSESLQRLSEIRDKIDSLHTNSENPSLNLARQMNGIPLIYYPWGLQAAAIRFKNSIQENMKNHAMTEDIIEASHNGIVSWEGKSDIIPVIIRGQDDHSRTKQRWRVLKEFFAHKGIDCMEVNSVNGSILSKIICLIYELDYSTIYGAVIRNIDPCPVSSIDFVKQKIAELKDDGIAG